MSEHEQHPEIPTPMVRLELPNGQSWDSTAKNTLVYLHDKGKKYDHLFIQNEDENEESDDRVMGLYVFRQDLSDFDSVVSYMRNNGFGVIEKETVAEPDKRNFRQDNPLPFAATVVDVSPRYELTLRQERFIELFRYLMDNDRIKPEDFDGRGDLYI